jgi:hypothetical protein
MVDDMVLFFLGRSKDERVLHRHFRRMRIAWTKENIGFNKIDRSKYITRAPRIEEKRGEKVCQVPPLSHSSGEYWEWVPPMALTVAEGLQGPLDPMKQGL